MSLPEPNTDTTLPDQPIRIGHMTQDEWFQEFMRNKIKAHGHHVKVYESMLQDAFLSGIEYTRLYLAANG